MTNPIAIGATAPDFKLKDNRGNEVSLNDYKGKKVLLSWHPLAWTPVCADQMKSLETNYARFEALGTIPLGLSIDAVPSKNAWAKELKIANIKMPSDFWPHGAVAKEYGLFREEEGFSERANVIIDENGKIIWIKIYDIHQLPDVEEVIQQLK
ncbi:redoxin domain-containing protein [Desulfosporosinus fructosivorans]|uniref:Redoxin domain-containing protein n=1 Tax=Desulfosporosinus fructosivorans TaxID=2018669 RepID=A0A4Z0QWY1_9FIRM|nr:redoxin domain-containing protein [Desulfosporosinus fructosivorans]TGE35311.1 redoxin domain-containing protein [Desulfosporosinus fructosivorans]